MWMAGRLGAIGFFSLLMVGEHNPPFAILILPLAILGFGIAFIMPAVTIAVLHSISEAQSGLASGVLNASRQVGSLIGVAIFGTIINTTSHFIMGMHITHCWGAFFTQWPRCYDLDLGVGNS